MKVVIEVPGEIVETYTSAADIVRLPALEEMVYMVVSIELVDNLNIPKLQNQWNNL